ncbi:DEAD/DEAH box helicase family protein [Paraflavisolibacter sp. H34]|uniref:EcoAI/FtnUII family type I restriction enzme subunit R n=1 Tax=Huijunlia imazamoxiresistens TaxID=3127457 RepID=UPI003016B54E
MPYSEADTRANYIDPALKAKNWQPHNIRREYYFTDGRKLFGGKRGGRCFVDYLLIYNNTFIGLIEAKSEDKECTEGLQQANSYAQKLKVRFLYATNGKRIYEFDVQEGRGAFIDHYPTPEELFEKAIPRQTPLTEKLLQEPLYLSGDKPPRYYQEIAVQKVMEGIAAGKRRLLLTLATGTGKTVIAFQIVHKLLQSKWNLDGADRRPRILFLADRNVLVDQAMNTFNPYEKDIIKINGEEIRKRNGIVPTNAYIFFAIYQAIAEKEDIGGYYKNYPKDFFDAVIIDECHRGSAHEEGSWRDILNHFNGAVHIGLTATPKREANVDTYDYFGQPLYEYSLKEGISDGFLTPYKVKRIQTNIDQYIYTQDDQVVKGEVSKSLYGLGDFDRCIIIPDRTALIARTILENIRPLDKTIVFCVDQDHALNMRDTLNQYKTVKDPDYCVRVTSDEGIFGRRLLERFQDNDRYIPIILTSSQMLTTGVDARNVRNIVLCRTINSIVEFKQIIGRGTRVFEGKDFFTIIDFTGASELFYDPEWDGPAEPIGSGSGGPKGPKTPPKSGDEGGNEEDPPPQPYERLEVRLSNGRRLKVTNIETRFIGADGRPLTARQFLEELVKVLPGLFEREEDLRAMWANPDLREKLLKDLSAKGFDSEHMESLTQMLHAEESDYFDLLAYLAFNRGIITRRQRASKVKEDKAYFDGYDQARAKQFLQFVLDRYEKDGVKELSREKLPQLIRLNQMGTPKEAANYFGGIQNMISAYYELQSRLYQF